jgi:hypothetical protein
MYFKRRIGSNSSLAFLLLAQVIPAKFFDIKKIHFTILLSELIPRFLD